jgi:hypothetical protein
MLQERSNVSRRYPSLREKAAPSIQAGLAALALVVAVGCNGSESPTSPRQPSPTPTPAADLNGSWTGTASQVGATDEYFCPSGGYTVDVQITQSRGQVTFVLPLRSHCAQGGEASYVGTLSGSTLSGELKRAETGGLCALDGLLHGTADPSHLVLTGRLSGTCNALSVDLDLRR